MRPSRRAAASPLERRCLKQLQSILGALPFTVVGPASFVGHVGISGRVYVPHPHMEIDTMSIYAVVQETIRNNPGLTAAQIAAKTGSEQVATDPMVQQLVTEGRVVQTGGTFSTATFAAASQPQEH